MTPNATSLTICGKTLAQVAEISGVPRRTLSTWCKSKPWLFSAICEKVKNDE